MNLDNVAEYNDVDRSGMLTIMDKTPERLRPPIDAGSTLAHQLDRPRNVVVGGVGGSGIIGDIVADFLRSISDVPVTVCRSLNLPAFVAIGTLFVAISYSGETPETLSLLDQALGKKATVVSIGSGGKLIEQSKRNKIGYLKVPEGMLPRLAIPELLASAILVMSRAGLIGNPDMLLRNCSKMLQSEIGAIGPRNPLVENKAKQMAQKLLGKLPLLIGNEDSASVLRRFKNELNENSKMPATCYALTEAYHDDVEGLKTFVELASLQPIVLRDEETEGQKRARERLYGLFNELGIPGALEFEGLGENRFERLVTAVTFGDYVSAYLALLREVDPSELALIPKFREAMRR